MWKGTERARPGAAGKDDAGDAFMMLRAIHRTVVPAETPSAAFVLELRRRVCTDVYRSAEVLDEVARRLLFSNEL